MKKLEIRCKKCKAQLRMNEESESIVCEYCNTENLVEPKSDILCRCGGKIKFLGKCKDCGKWG